MTLDQVVAGLAPGRYSVWIGRNVPQQWFFDLQDDGEWTARAVNGFTAHERPWASFAASREEWSPDMFERTTADFPRDPFWEGPEILTADDRRNNSTFEFGD